MRDHLGVTIMRRRLLPLLAAVALVASSIAAGAGGAAAVEAAAVETGGGGAYTGAIWWGDRVANDIGAVELGLGGRQNCTGTLVEATWVLTAAHCVVFGDEVVVPGYVDRTRDVSNDGTGSGYEVRAAVEVVVHPTYAGDAVGGLDLALVRIDRPFDDPGELLAFAFGPTEPDYAFTPAAVGGYGQNERGGVDYDFRVAYGALTRPGNDSLCSAPDQAVCFVSEALLGGDGGGFPCFGDSGGPVVTRHGSGTLLLVGVTTYVFQTGTACDTQLYTGVTRVAPAAGWITDVTGVLGFGEQPTDPLPPDQVSLGRPSTIAVLPDGTGYWIFTDRGEALAYGAAPFLGDLAGVPLNGPIVASAPTPTGRGYYLVGADGGIFTFGDATFHGSMGGVPLNRPVVGIAPDPDGVGYWLVAADGGIFSFEAPFRGSLPAIAPVLNRPVVGAIAHGDGYLMVASDGGVFNFSDQDFLGSLGDRPPPTPVTAVAAFPGGDGGPGGYWMTEAGGGIHAFGAATGHPGGVHLGETVSAATTPDGDGLWLLTDVGEVATFGAATWLGGAVPAPEA